MRKRRARHGRGEGKIGKHEDNICRDGNDFFQWGPGGGGFGLRV